MNGLVISLHVLAAVIWVGGMFFAYMALRPAALKLEPPQRLMLWSETFERFFPWVWGSVVVLPFTGYWMIFSMFGSFDSTPLYALIMQYIGLAMIAIYLHVFFAPYRRLRRFVAAEDFASAGKQLAQIRKLIALNLSLGLITVILASSRAI
jgi:uncharacterized membrane protein